MKEPYIVTPVPDWLTTPDPTATRSSLSDFLQDGPAREQRMELVRQMRHAEFEAAFETTLDKLTQGMSLNRIIKSDFRELDGGKFMSWIKKDQKRLARYYEALEIGAEILASQVPEIAEGIGDDGNPVMEDFNRSKLRIDSIKWQVGYMNRKRFGETKTLEVVGNISVTDALRDANARVMEAQLVDISDAQYRLEDRSDAED